MTRARRRTASPAVSTSPGERTMTATARPYAARDTAVTSAVIGRPPRP
ncbi:hypothetical protein [Streptomyces chromofuscus]|uniref:Uncharacterized protein n=1 Tax=Streptomyces chromofuscus TaxID=42881 RepID=A0A7M2TIB9_STRCW|nr:hypothetical protein [Streptomyces chromofuscus]QOV47909.1 hypothetical protein IPT68_03225 [Streptomyces chromofuscus]